MSAAGAVRAASAACSAADSIACAARRAYAWSVLHRKAATLVLALAVALASSVAVAASPGTAHAIAPIIVGIIALVAGGAAVSVGFSEVETTIEDALRNAANTSLAGAGSMLQVGATGQLLTTPFDSIYPAVQPIVYNVHQAVCIPAANVVLVVFMVVGLGKVMQRMGQTETGVDMWQLVMVFVGYAFAKAMIDASYELMVLAFDFVRHIIVQVLSMSGGSSALEVQGIPESVKGMGWLLVACVVSLIVWFATWLVSLLAQVVVMVRAVQIYVYTAFGSLPLAFLASESSRPMATGFLKRYIALLFAGAIMALLFVMYGAVVGQIGTTSVVPDTWEHGVQFLCELMMSLGAPIAFGWCLFKSGSWARDFVGV